MTTDIYKKYTGETFDQTCERFWENQMNDFARLTWTIPEQSPAHVAAASFQRGCERKWREHSGAVCREIYAKK